VHVVSGDESPKPQTSRTSFIINEYWREWVEQESLRLNASKSSIYLTALAEYRERQEGAGGAAWDTVDDDVSYDPHHFYTHSQDKKGHSFHLRVNLPKPLAGAAGALIQTGRIPQYRTIEDIARDAFYHRIKQISRAIDDDELEEAVDMAMLMADELQLMAKEDEAESYIAAVRTNVERLWQRREWAALRKYLADKDAVVDSIPNPYSGELEDIIRDYRKKINRGRKRVRE